MSSKMGTAGNSLALQPPELPLLLLLFSATVSGATVYELQMHAYVMAEGGPL